MNVKSKNKCHPELVSGSQGLRKKSLSQNNARLKRAEFQTSEMSNFIPNGYNPHPNPLPRRGNAYAFTLAEVLITLVIIGVVAALTVPTMIAKYHEQQTVAKVEKAFSIVSQAWYKYQNDNSCYGKVANCFATGDAYNNMEFYNRFIKYFNAVKVIPPNTTLEGISWLPEKAYHINNSEVSSNLNWFAVHKNSGTSGISAYLTLTDGSIIHIHMPDTKKKSGFVFVDTNGKKGPNRVGKDQFPIGIGAFENPKYENKVHPFYNEDDNSYSFNGLCRVTNNNECNPDVCTQDSCSPTAYVLKNKKLPPITW